MKTFQRFVLGWIQLLQSLVLIFSFGFVWLNWASDYMGYCLIKNLKEVEDKNKDMISRISKLESNLDKLNE